VVRDAGQRFMVGFEGTVASAEIRGLIRDFAAGNVVLAARNVDTPEQVADLVRELQGIGRSAGLAAPLLIAVEVLPEPWTVWPPLRTVGRLPDDALARRMASGMAEEMVAVGIHAILSPVLDLAASTEQSLGEDPEKVGRFASALIEALQRGRVAACARPFPGGGDTQPASEAELPVADHSLRRLEELELRPFRHAIAGGVGMIMAGHILLPEIDERFPASLSPRLVQGVLRGRLAYDGVVMTDDLERTALTARFPVGESVARAAEAGCDLFLLPSPHADVQVDAIEALVRATEGPTFPLARREEPVRRLRRLKERFLLPFAEPDLRRTRRLIGSPGHHALAREIAERGAA
jgi:beta-N-acetylhexosaminidase